MEYIVSKYNFWVYILLMMIGFYAMIGKKNLVKKLIGMNIFQTAIILYFISTAVKRGATVPVLLNHGHHGPVAQRDERSHPVRGNQLAPRVDPNVLRQARAG